MISLYEMRLENNEYFKPAMPTGFRTMPQDNQTHFFG